MNRPEILDKAKSCVCGQRENEYGSPERNFQRIAELWTAYFGREDVVFTPVDVSMMMSLLKIARIKSGNATDDSFVDLAGYAACGGELASIARDGENSSITQDNGTAAEISSEEA